MNIDEFKQIAIAPNPEGVRHMKQAFNADNLGMDKPFKSMEIYDAEEDEICFAGKCLVNYPPPKGSGLLLNGSPD